MTKAFTRSFTGILLAGLISSTANSQSSIDAARPKPQSPLEKILPKPSQINSAEDSDFVFRNEININAVRSFTRNYKNVSDAKWRKLKDGFSVAYFDNDSVRTMVLYSKTGSCESITRYYLANKLPADVRDPVKSTYDDFDIYHVIESTINGVTSYLIKMEGKSTWKTVRVVDGEMEVVEEYFKLN